MDEHETRHVPYDAAEVAWARNRPARHRTPRPQLGDALLYRHREWADPEPCRLLEWVDLDNPNDPLMYRTVVDERSPFRAPVTDGAGRRLVEPVDDPWPLVLLDTPHGLVTTREARLRGSAGWLPLDWRARYRPTPAVGLIVAATPAPAPRLGEPWVAPPQPGPRPLIRP